MFKSISMISDEMFSDFQRVPRQSDIRKRRANAEISAGKNSRTIIRRNRQKAKRSITQ